MWIVLAREILAESDAIKVWQLDNAIVFEVDLATQGFKLSPWTRLKTETSAQLM